MSDHRPFPRVGAQRTGAARDLPRLAQLLRRVLLLGVLLLTVPSAAAAQSTRTDLSDIEDEVMCVQCQRPLVTSAGRAAEDQRKLMQEWIDEGLTKDEVKARLVDEYGERVLVDDRSGIAAAAPWLAAAVGVLSIGSLLRRRRQRADATDPSPASVAPATGPVTPADDARIDAELEDRG